MYTFQVPLLPCLVGCIILSIGLGLGGVSVDGSNIKKMLRVARNACGTECPGDNFDTHAYYCDENLNKCCRVCEKGQYKSSNCWHDIVNYGEYKYNCSYCEEGYYQPDTDKAKLATECKECPAPSITCQPGYKIHCDRETGEHSCQEDITTPEVTTVPELSTDISEAGNGTETETAKPAPQKDGLSDGGIVGIILGVIAVIIGVLIYYCIKRYRERHQTKGDYQEMEKRGGDAAPTANDACPGEANNDDTVKFLDTKNEAATPTATTNVCNGPAEAKDGETDKMVDTKQNSQQGDEDDEGEPAAQLGDEGIDDSHDYILKDGVTFNDFKLEVAVKLPLDTIHPFYTRIGLDKNEYEHAEADEPGNQISKKYAVLSVWAEKIGDLGDECKVRKLLSALWRLNLKGTRRLIISECCCNRNVVKAELLSSSPV